MTTKDDGGQAFPCEAEWKDGAEVWPASKGMTLRAWLTGQALAGLCANPETWASDSIGRWAVEAADSAVAGLNAAQGATSE